MHVAFICNVRDLFQSHTLTLDKVAHAVFAVHSRLHFLHNVNSYVEAVVRAMPPFLQQNACLILAKKITKNN